MLEEKRINRNIIEYIYIVFIQAIRNLLYNIKSNIILFIVCLVIGVGMIYIKSSVGKVQYYDVSFTVSYDELIRKIYGDRIEKINELLKLRQYNKITTFLNVNRATAESLVMLKGKNILGENLSEDMNADKIPFVVTMRLKDTASIKPLQAGVVEFLSTGNEYMANRMILKKKETEEELKFIDEQLAMMDSLKRRFNSSSVTYTNDKANTSPGSIYEFSFELYKRRQELMRKIEMPENLQIIDDAIVPKVARTSMGFVGIVGIAAGLLLYIFIVGIVIPVFRDKFPS